MPIEIKELVIRATVEREPQQSTVPEGVSYAQIRALRDRIDELMQMINERNER